ncbi:MAG TPA: hypothetical protein VF292_08625 [Rhodanobacteraceae bacterium]
MDTVTAPGLTPFERSFARNRAQRPDWYIDPVAPGVPAAAVDFYLAVLGLPGWKAVCLSNASPDCDSFCFAPDGHCATPLDGVLPIFMGLVSAASQVGARAYVDVDSRHGRRGLYYATLGSGAWFPVSPEQVQIECPQQDPSSGRAWPRVRTPLHSLRVRQAPLPRPLTGALRYAARATHSGPVSRLYNGLQTERGWILKASAGWGRYSRRLGVPVGRVRGRLLARAVAGVPGTLLQRFDDLASGAGSPLTADEAAVRTALAGVMALHAANADVGETAFAHALDAYIAGARKGASR